MLDVEADLTGRLAARAAHSGSGPSLDAGIEARLDAGAERLDVGQAAVVTALAGDRPLVVVEGVAGAGKTTSLAATRGALNQQGRRLMVVTPTLKAA